MALHLYFSNDVERLGCELADKLNAAWDDPLKPPPLLVPNRYMEKWLKLFISKKQGVLLGLYGEFIEKFLWRILVEETDNAVPLTMIDGPLLCQVLLSVMRQVENANETGDLAALRNYLSSGPQAGLVRRRTGLATRLSGLFLEYEYSRPDLYDQENVRRFDGLLTAWPDNDYFATKNPEALFMEAWQRQLYKRAMETVRDCLGPGHVTLPGALSGGKISLAGIARRAHDTGLRGPVFVFGMSGMSLFHRQAMLGLSRAVDVHVFTLNPCSAFWEDADTTGREMAGRVGKTIGRNRVDALTFDGPRWTSFGRDDWDDSPAGAPIGASRGTRKTDIQGQSGDVDENRLLTLWGQAGRENIALWCQAADYRFNELYADVPGGSVLAETKRCVLYRQNKAKKRCVPDTSLIVFDAQGIRREVETMRDYVLEAMRSDGSLLPSDIGVFVTDAKKYQAALHETLDEYPAGHPFHVPWLMADEKGSASLFCKAVADILRLPDGGFGRSAVFSLLRNPLVAAACGADGAILDIWENWAVQCRVGHGLDKSHRLSLGEHDPSPQHTWRMAFERLLSAGICGGGEADLEFASSGDPEETVRPFQDMESQDTELCGRFVRTVEALFRDVGSLAEQKTWTQASEKLIAIVRAWTRFPQDFSDEERVADQFVEEIALFASRDRLAEAALDFEEFRTLALERADMELPAPGASLTGRLTVSRIRPSRAIPFKIVYVLGMNEGSFPGGADTDTLDLRTWKHVPGDLRPFRQAQYAFLELLVCARQALVLSFTGHDLARDAPLFACSTVLELQSFVNDAVLEPGMKLTFSRVPLLAEGEDRSARAARGLWQPPTYNGEAALMARLWSASGQDASKPASKPAPRVLKKSSDGQAPETVHFTTTRLALFLRNPLEYTLRKSFNLDDESDLVIAGDTEPFAAAAMDRWRIKQRFVDHVCDRLFGTRRGPIPDVKADEDLAQEWDDCLRKAYRHAIIDGRAAERVFADFDMLGLAAETRALAGTLGRIAREKHEKGWIYEPSCALWTHTHGAVRPYAELPLEDNRVLRVSSPVHRVFLDPENENRCEVLAVCVSGGAMADNEVIRRKHLFEPMLFSCVKTACGRDAECSVRFAGLTKKNSGAQSVLRCFGGGAAEAQGYLTCLVRAAGDPLRRFDHVPFEIIEDLWAAGGGLTQRDVEDRLAENDETGFRQVYRCNLEACAIVNKSVPDDDALSRLVRERFGIVFNDAAGGGAP